MNDFRNHRRPRQRGFTLIEILVGMAIGMTGIIVMMQVFSFSEGNKRATTGSADAQNNGVIALNGIERDMRQAGLGLADVKVLGCELSLPASGVVVPQLAPVVINPVTAAGAAFIPPGDPGSDTLLIAYGGSAGSPQGDLIISQNAANATYNPRTPTSFAAGDRVIAAPQARPFPCSFASGNYLRLETVRAITPAPPAAPVQIAMTTTANVGARTSGTLFNLGAAPTFLAYAVRNGNLAVCDLALRDCTDSTRKNDPVYWNAIGSNVVGLRAQYGRDELTPKLATPGASAAYVVDRYDQATPDAAVADAACKWMRTGAIRLALVARSGQYDKAVVTTEAPLWAGSVAGTPANSAAAPFDLSRTPSGAASADWQHYRYRVFQTVVPLRNLNWVGVQPAC